MLLSAEAMRVEVPDRSRFLFFSWRWRCFVKTAALLSTGCISPATQVLWGSFHRETPAISYRFVLQSHVCVQVPECLAMPARKPAQTPGRHRMRES